MIYLNILSLLLLTLGVLLIGASKWEYNNINKDKKEKSLGVICISNKRIIRVLVLGVLFIFVGLVSLITKNSIVIEVGSKIAIIFLGIIYLIERKVKVKNLF